MVTLPVKVAATPVTFVTAMVGEPLSPPAVPDVLPVTSPVKSPTKVVAVATPVITMPPGFACAFTLPPSSFSDVTSIPVKLEPSPKYDFATTPVELNVTIPAALLE